AIADHQRERPRHAAARACETLRGSFIEPASEIGTSEIVAAAAGPARDLDRAKTERAKRGCESGCIEGRVNGVARARMIEREVEKRGGRQARTGSADRHARRCERAEVCDRSRRLHNIARPGHYSAG